MMFLQLSKFNDLPASGLQKLEEVTSERDNLRLVVHEMRREMERLGAELRSAGKSSTRTEEGSARQLLQQTDFKHSVASGTTSLRLNV